MMTSQEIRKQFLDFFESKQHRIISSAPVVPFNDPTLLFTNAGMNQFKDVFLGQGKRDYARVADTQKCIRVSGKHNDLEEVGRDTYHHTFFEMLGNWSFGDYYKKEAIAWAWELLTEVWKLPKEKLWATVYRTDDESLELWKSETDIDHSHILKFDEKDNFWEMGETGPCGPCSEIHINLSDNLEDASIVNAGVAECIEIWNLVFVQYNRDTEGKLHDLPSKHVDTGMGFERLCAVIQGKNSNYDSDVFQPLLNAISSISSIKYDKEDDMIAMRVIADHVRTLTFAIADGAVPGNEGRSYVLRRILRRACRYGRNLNLHDPFLYKLVQVVVDTMADVFPEIKSNQTNIEKIIKSEEKSFNVTLDRGLDLFAKLEKKLLQSGEKVVPGDDVFKLYDTFGFPVDLVNVMAEEKGFTIDEERFNVLMTEQKERARKSAKNKMAGTNVVADSTENFDIFSDKPTKFTGYTSMTSEAKIIGVKNDEKNSLLILDKSPFYVESGGQVSDKGFITVDEKQFKVIALSKIDNQLIHIVDNEKGFEFKNEIKVAAEITPKHRWDIMRNHSATHFLHAALREILGVHVKQSGSYVGSDRLRFDFTHFSKLTDEEINQIETDVNGKIFENIPLTHHNGIPFDAAKEMGALMFFGDKYGDTVNVVQFGKETLEFCGGCHVQNSSQIGLFKIVSESSIASGVRRIEAVTGLGVEKYIETQNQKIKDTEVKLSQLADEKKRLEKELAVFQLQEKLGGIDSIVSNPEDVSGIAVFKGKVNAANMDELKSMADEFRNKIKSGVGMLVSEFDGKVGIVSVVTDDLIKDKKIMAGKIVGAAAKIVGGGGGGKPHMATAGGKDVTKIDELVSTFGKIIKEFV